MCPLTLARARASLPTWGSRKRRRKGSSVSGAERFIPLLVLAGFQWSSYVWMEQIIPLFLAVTGIDRKRLLVLYYYFTQSFYFTWVVVWFTNQGISVGACISSKTATTDHFTIQEILSFFWCSLSFVSISLHPPHWHLEDAIYSIIASLFIDAGCRDFETDSQTN